MKTDYNKAKLVIIRVLLKTARIGSAHYLPWCYQLIAELDEPPQWLLDMSYTGNIRDAQAILHSYIYREGPTGDILHETDLEIAVLYLDYQADEVSWEAFLLTIGQLSDRCEGRVECSWFFALLNEYEAASGLTATRIKQQQQKLLKKLYKKELDQIVKFETLFEKFYDKGVR